LRAVGPTAQGPSRRENLGSGKERGYVQQGVNKIKDEIAVVTGDVLHSIETALSLNGLSDGSLKEWKRIVSGLSRGLHEGVLKVAVVGAIKSGKSTFVNALLGQDYLKRGAGVMTSIITRVRASSRLEAVLDLKGWDEVNEEIRSALVLFPFFDGASDVSSFDIRNENDRKKLAQSLESLERSQVIGKETLDSKIALLGAYMKGYERIKVLPAVESGSVYRLEGRERFAGHRDFAGDDSLAVYLRDLLIRVPVAGFLDDTTEIADCQGVDSINPRHLAMIQQYLLEANLIIYVISSRTGIRRADVSFLTLIRQMGFADTVLFVLNVDMQEHDGMADLLKIRDRVREELTLVTGEPKLFTFSSLYALYARLDKSLSEKEHRRFDLWRMDEEMTSFCDEEQKRLIDLLGQRLYRDRRTFLLKNHLTRLAGAAADLREWTAFNAKILSGSTEEARRTLESVKTLREKLDMRKQAIKDSLDGRAGKVKRILADDTDRLLDGRFGEISRDIHEFVDRYAVDLRTMIGDMEGTGFSALLYTLFQEFRESLERFIVEKVTPRLAVFIREEERKVEDMFLSIAEVYDGMVQDAHAHHLAILEKAGVEPADDSHQEPFSLRSFQRKTRPPAPSFLSTLQFGAEIRAGAILKLGMYRGLRFIRKLLKRPDANDDAGRDVLAALDAAMRRIKRETQVALVSTINGYKENLKYQHLNRFVDETAAEILDVMGDRFRVFSSDMSGLASLIDNARGEREEALDLLKALEQQTADVLERVRRVERRINSDGGVFQPS